MPADIHGVDAFDAQFIKTTKKYTDVDGRTSDDLCDMIVLRMEHTSTDAETQVGCVITTKNDVLVCGANTHTSGMAVTNDNSYRPEKYHWIEHAERNAIYEAARLGVSLKDSTMYLPGFPCVECARAIVQSGVTKLFHGTTEGFDDAIYKFDKAKFILEMGGVKMIERILSRKVRRPENNV